MINSIEQYLAELKKELSKSDRATIQDALSDAEEYLRTALNNARDVDANISEADALAAIVAKYGAPGEVAAAYKEIESRTPPAFTGPVPKKSESLAVPVPAVPVSVDSRPFYARFFGVFADARAWGALLYLIFAMGTGIIYFSWAVTGLSTSFGLLVLIIGIPIFALFLLSVRGIALMEGRLIEALVGVRMPRRPLFSRKDIGWWQKVKKLFAERQTWTAIFYMLFQMPLGIIYFSVFISLIATSFWLVFQPVFGFALNIPSFVIGDYGYFTPAWALPFGVIGGVLLLTATMHLTKYTGKAHGAWAKLMLVRE